MAAAGMTPVERLRNKTWDAASPTLNDIGAALLATNLDSPVEENKKEPPKKDGKK